MTDYKARNMGIVRELCSGLKKSNIAVTGSTNYGNGIEYPNENSDIDMIVLDSDEIRNTIKRVYKGPDYVPIIYNGEFDLICINAVIQNTRLSFNIFCAERYQKLCSEINKELIVFKDLRGRGVKAKATAPYYLSSFFRNIWLSYEIDSYREGHKIKCPAFSFETFTLSSFQEEILTQSEVIDNDNLLLNGRITLTQLVLVNAKCLKASPINLHRVKKPFWSEEFTKQMADRYGR